MNSKSYIGFFRETLFVQIALVAVFVVVIVFFGWSFEGLPEASDDDSLATLIISLDKGSRMFQGEVIEGMTVLDALITSSNAGNIYFNYTMRNDGTIDVTEINGHSKNNSNFIYYLNDLIIEDRDLDRTNIKAGDNIRVEFR
jgi:hypothetical protein